MNRIRLACSTCILAAAALALGVGPAAASSASAAQTLTVSHRSPPFRPARACLSFDHEHGDRRRRSTAGPCPRQSGA